MWDKVIQPAHCIQQNLMVSSFSCKSDEEIKRMTSITTHEQSKYILTTHEQSKYKIGMKLT